MSALEAAEPRTTANIVRDLLRIVVERQWTKDACYLGRGESGDGCPDCEACESLSIARYLDGERKTFGRDEHRTGCPTAALILEARAFLSAEEPDCEVP